MTDEEARQHAVTVARAIVERYPRQVRVAVLYLETLVRVLGQQPDMVRGLVYVKGWLHQWGKL